MTKIPEDQKTLKHYLQSRRTYLLYKRSEWLTSPSEDSELEQITKKLNESKHTATE